MIRRDAPRGSEAPTHWLLISQPEHARLSYELAAAWDASLVPSHVRDELLGAIRHHDDGWLGWIDAPMIDPESSRPLAFTEMPTADAQQIWTDSIDACRRIGLLAGWVVASHFGELQSKRDGDYSEWIDWLAETDARREAVLAEWLAAGEPNTRELAQRCLAWLQTFDWLSLWLCCRCPVLRGDQPIEPLSIGGDETGWPTVAFTPESKGVVRVEPWPFVETRIELQAAGRKAPAKRYSAGPDLFHAASPIELLWELTP